MMPIKVISSLQKLFSTTSSTLIKTNKTIAPIKISQSASNRLTFLINQHTDMEHLKGIRIGVKKRGCSGLSYVMNYIHNTKTDCEKVKNDDVILLPNTRTSIFIDPKSVMTIVGTTMDYIDTEISSEFTFTNPNSKGSCGCGESFLT